jgi:hypothetical protein
MRLVTNFYSLDFHASGDEHPPIAGAKREVLPFGLPPFELRAIWTFELSDFAFLISTIKENGVSLILSESAFWSGPSIQSPGERLLGVSVIDDPNAAIDPRDQPLRLS